MACLYIVVLAFIYSTVVAQSNYCQLTCDGKTHTVCARSNVNCGASSSCGSSYKPVALTTSDRQLILDVHNELRNRVATGQETIGNQPSASNMNALSYNSELGTIAQCWSNNCNFGHDECRRTATYPWVGQNVGIKMNSVASADYRSVINSTIRSWYSEVKYFSASGVSSYSFGSGQTGHYTQVVWAKTNLVGCGLTGYFANGWNNLLFVCNYATGGNVGGQSIYQIGAPASQCSGSSPNPKYSGLCGPDNVN